MIDPLAVDPDPSVLIYDIYTDVMSVDPAEQFNSDMQAFTMTVQICPQEFEIYLEAQESPIKIDIYPDFET